MLLSAALISSSMVACGGPNVPDSTTTPPGNFKEAFAQLEARGELPVLDRTDTIAGIDANQNGVRDDIEAFINSLPDTPVQKKRLYNLQRALNNSMLVDLNDKYRLRGGQRCQPIRNLRIHKLPGLCRKAQTQPANRKNDSKHPSALPCVHAVQQRAGRIGLHHGPGFCMSNV